MARRIIDQLTRQTVDCLLEAAFAEDGHPWPAPQESLAHHPVTQRALDRAPSLLALSARLSVPVIGLGASAACYYGAVAERLGTEAIIPAHAGVANAVGAVVGQVSMRVDGSVTCPGPGLAIAHIPEGPTRHGDVETAVAALTEALSHQALARARQSGVPEPRLAIARHDLSAEVEGQAMIVEVKVSATATGRPRIARDESL